MEGPELGDVGKRERLAKLIRKYGGALWGRVSPVEVVVLVVLPIGMGMAHAAGRRFEWLAWANLKLTAGLLSWIAPCLLVHFTGRLLRLRRRVVRGLYLGYYWLLALFLIGSNIEAALIRTGWLMRGSAVLYSIAVIDGLLVLPVLGAAFVARRRDGLHADMVILSELIELTYILRLLVSLGILFAVYSNLKALIPVFRTGLWDPVYYQWDKLLFFGHDPLPILAGAFGERFRALMERSYFFLFFFLIFGLSAAYVYRSVRYFEKALLAMVLTYVLGTAAYYIAPSVGPAFHDQTWNLFAGTSGAPLKASLYRSYRAICEAPRQAPIHLFQGLAAFPSLHVAVMVVFLYYLWYCERLLVYTLLPPMLLMTVSTVYLGWHYVVDIPGGIAVGAAGIWLADRMIVMWKGRARRGLT